MTEQRISVTAIFCSDPPPGRSALDGYQQIGDIDGGRRVNDYYDRGHCKHTRRKYKKRETKAEAE
jgi:hypothetical protein